MKRFIILFALLMCTSFAVKAQVNEASNYFAQNIDLREGIYTPAQIESMFALPGQQSDPYGYKNDTQWKVGTGLLIAGGVCFGVVGVSFVALACSQSLDDFFANSLILAWSSVVVGSAGAILMVTGGILMGTARSNFAAAKFDLGDGPAYAQLGLTRSGNLGLSLTF